MRNNGVDEDIENFLAAQSHLFSKPPVLEGVAIVHFAAQLLEQLQPKVM